MLAGVVEHLSTVKVDALSYLTLGRWGTEGFLRIQSDKITTIVFENGQPTTQSALSGLFYSKNLQDNGGTFVSAFDHMYSDILVVTVLGIITYVLTYYSLKKKDTI